MDSGTIGEASTAPVSAQVGSTVARLLLPARLGYPEASALHEQLVPLVEADEVVLAAGGVEQMSTAAVLVIISFLNARPSTASPAAIENVSETFVDAFSDIGLFQDLMRMEFRT